MEGTKMFDFLFGKNKDQYASEYDTAIKNAKQDRADAAYNYRYNKALYDANKDYFDKIGVKDPSASYWNDTGQRTNAFTETMNQYGKYLNDLNKEKEDVAWKNRYNIFGDGVIGNLLNPFHQAGTAVQDFVSSGTKEWDNGNRDVLSDLGAIGESALTVAPLAGGLLKTGGGVAKAGAKSLGKTMLEGAGYGAGYGALGGITDMGAKNFDLGQLALNTGIGAAVGGGMSGLGYGLGKVWNKYSQPAPSKSTDIIPSATKSGGEDNKYQEYLKTLTDNKLDTSSADALHKSYRKVVKPLHTDKAMAGTANEKLFKTIDEAYRAFYGKGGENYADAMAQATAPAVSSAPMATSAPTLSFAEKLKNVGSNISDTTKNVTNKVTNSKVGTNVANLLKTKKGKLLFGGTAGLTLAGLMKNRKDNNTGQLSDKEMQELYNYVYGGQ